MDGDGLALRVSVRIRQLTWLGTPLAAALPAAAGAFGRLEVLAEEPLASERLGRSSSGGC